MASPSQDFEQLESFFSKVELPQSIKLDSGTLVPDVSLFVKNNLDALRSGEMNQVAADGRYYRLGLLKAILEQKPKTKNISK